MWKSEWSIVREEWVTSEVMVSNFNGSVTGGRGHHPAQTIRTDLLVLQLITCYTHLGSQQLL